MEVNQTETRELKRREDVEIGEDTTVCRFCYPSVDESILLETPETYVMPTLGQFVEGYVMLIYKEHEDCFGTVVDRRVREVLARVEETLRDEYGAFCAFEHGRTGSCLTRRNNQICYHAHIHCLPVEKDFTARIAEDWERRPLDDITDLRDEVGGETEYLYLQTDDGTQSMFTVDGDLERQYLRKRACEAMGLPEKYANWQKHPFHSKMENTVEQLAQSF